MLTVVMVPVGALIIRTDTPFRDEVGFLRQPSVTVTTSKCMSVSEELTVPTDWFPEVGLGTDCAQVVTESHYDQSATGGALPEGTICRAAGRTTLSVRTEEA
nr:hypothetical protein [Escherichia coli]